ncbi:MAG: putative toxin-antitoxin system toxin component, PIN family [Chloroflexi bacterium]|nr:MAG: putative toxin-antitoxin system toxin component, PIN family [Chloroflexota bacterium]
MKVILDANVYVSYLLGRRSMGSVTQVVETCMANPQIELIVPPELLDEIRRTLLAKPYLRSRISSEDRTNLHDALVLIAHIPTPLAEILPLSRDPKDDYLLAHGLIEQVDYLVTGDDDLLALQRIDDLKIVSVPSFQSVLHNEIG